MRLSARQAKLLAAVANREAVDFKRARRGHARRQQKNGELAEEWREITAKLQDEAHQLHVLEQAGVEA